ncbi:MAG TPA: GNAT family N-acetyltransferase [Casimicrobiaceae bacterium]|nr:GNAT family N-acetyltransferase [Casimicrobiaceae bacterium]
MTTAAPCDIVHNAAAQRFEVVLDGALARCDYRRVGNVLQLHHTEVPKALEGRGIAGRLVEAALGWAKAEGLQIAPYCSYVRAYMKRHPETQPLLAPGQQV